MKYYLDTEFITGFKKPIPFFPTVGNFNKEEFFIELVSIGVVSEDDREYYAVSNEFNPDLADNWVKENVLYEIIADSGMFNRNLYNLHGVTEYNRAAMKVVQKHTGKSIIEIRNDIIDFMGGGCDDFGPELFVPSDTDVYAYYADYDWVVFCSIFGRMIDLPSGMPMYCKDLKQILDEKAESKKWYYGRDILSNTNNRGEDLQAESPASLSDKLDKIKRHDDYPRKINEHNALDDARWNKKLHEFILSL